MKDYEIKCKVRVFQPEELAEDERELIESALDATLTSYSPYSHFQVGAALRMSDGSIVRGSNQENAAYPVASCAERTALFWAGANLPALSVDAIAIAARTQGQLTPKVTAPCGMCRQALIEQEHRQGHDMRVYLYCREGVFVVESVSQLLPFSFYAESMEL